MRHGGESSHLELQDLVDGVDFALQAEFVAHSFGAFAQLRGREDVAGLVDQGAGEVLCLGDDDAFVEGALDFGRRSGYEDGGRVDALVLAVAAVKIDVEVGDDSSFGDGTCGQLGGESFMFREDEREIAEVAWPGETDRDAGTFADLVGREGFSFAEADEEEPFGLEARRRVEQQRLAERRFELAGGEPGGGGGGDGGGAGEQGGGGGRVFRCRGIDGEDGEERRDEVGGGEGLELDVHMFMVTRRDQPGAYPPTPPVFWVISGINKLQTQNPVKSSIQAGYGQNAETEEVTVILSVRYRLQKT